MNSWRVRASGFVNSSGIDHELMVVAVSYLFVFAGAWNDGIIGLPPSRWSAAFQGFMVLVLSLEIFSRLALVKIRRFGFYGLLAFDIISLATVIPALTGFALFRIARLLFASWRTIRLLDKVACKKREPMYLLYIYPLVVPFAAALLYAVERESDKPHVTTYFDALGMCFGFALTLGDYRPSTYIGNLICGALFVGGILCIGIIANSLTDRYVRDD